MLRHFLLALLLVSSLALLRAHEGCGAESHASSDSDEGQCSLPGPSAAESRPPSSNDEIVSPTLDRIRARGSLICAHVDDTLGHSKIVSRTEASGMEPDLCKGLAAALGVKPEFHLMNAPIALSLTSKTIQRDMYEQGSFSIPYFNDQHNMMYRSDSGISSAASLRGKRICVTAGTTNPNVFADYLASIASEIGGVDQVQVVTVPDENTAFEYLRDNECQGFVNDDSVVAGYVHSLTPPAGVTYHLASWPGTPFARAPFSAVSLDGDAQFASVVDWFVNSLFLAEMYGVTAANVDEKAADSSLPGEAQRLLGAQPVGGHKLVFDMRAAIKAIGNYAEVYERNFAHFFPRSRANTLYQNGGAVIPGGFR